MANYRMIENVEEMSAYRDGDMTVFEPRDVVGKIEYQDGVKRIVRLSAELIIMTTAGQIGDWQKRLITMVKVM